MTIPALKDAFKDHFLVGTAIEKRIFEADETTRLALVKQQYNALTSCNMLKWERFNPMPGQYAFEPVDQFLKLAEGEDMYIVGHVLFWHEQTPAWVFQDDQGNEITRDALLARMRERVRIIAERYGTRIHVWDVVNEAINDDGSPRDTPWHRIIGPDFLEQAFRIADEELPKDVALIYNDYSMAMPGRRDAVLKLVQEFKKKGIRIDGIGMQGHWALDYPEPKDVEESIIAYGQTGLKVHITELDVAVLPREEGMFGADVSLRYPLSDENNPYPDGFPPEMQEKLAQRYKAFFEVFLRQSAYIERVTFWGVADGDSWLNGWPIPGRTSYPLLFDREYQPKPAFHAVVGLCK
jgi:endo-1,4-beta-xylanase